MQFLPIKITSTHKKLSAVSSSKWIVSELFNFSNHSKLIAFRILILRGLCWFQWSDSLCIIFSSSFVHRRWGVRSEDSPPKFWFSYYCITCFVRSSRSYVFYKRVSLQNVAKVTEETSVLESVFNKDRLSTLTKRPGAGILLWIFRNY